jgi:sec-independent protein translocase protein TatB
MFDIGFSEILVIFVLALIVLGPEKLPRVVREVGRWVGRARAMARQFQEQLEEEVDVDRGRSIRPEPVRPVGGVPAQPASPEPEYPEPVAAAAAAPWHTTPEPQLEPQLDSPPEPAAASGGPPVEPHTVGTHERGT